MIACNTAFTYKGKAVDVKQLGRELGVRSIALATRHTEHKERSEPTAKEPHSQSTPTTVRKADLSFACATGLKGLRDQSPSSKSTGHRVGSGCFMLLAAQFRMTSMTRRFDVSIIIMWDTPLKGPT